MCDYYVILTWIGIVNVCGIVVSEGIVYVNVTLPFAIPVTCALYDISELGPVIAILFPGANVTSYIARQCGDCSVLTC